MLLSNPPACTPSPRRTGLRPPGARFLSASIRIAALSFPGAAAAMQPCRDGTVVCPSPLQVLLLIVLPLTLLIIVLRRLQRSSRSQRFKHTLATLLTLIIALWLLLIMAAFSMFLAPCDAVCWLRPGTW